MHDAVWIAVIGGAFSVLVAMLHRTHRLVNSRLTEMIALAEEVGIAKGKKQEIERRDAEDLVKLRNKGSGSTD